MSDIVERLRLDVEPTESDMEEAAAEIERLRAEVLEQARLLGMSGEREAKLLAEIECLRARVAELEYAYSKCLAAVGGVQQDAGPP